MHSYLVVGGCITHRFDAALTDDVASYFIIDAALWTLSREKLVSRVESDSDLALCGAFAPPCEGGEP